jgi:MBG domain (YGX type)
MITKTARGALLLLVLLRFSIPASADRPTNIALSPAAGTYGGTTTLQATLTSTGRPVPNQTISFALNDTPVGSATTNSNGVAILANVSLAGIAAQTYSKGVTAIFAGTADLRSNQRTATLTVNPAPASVTPNPASKTVGTSDPPFTGTLSGFLASDNVTGARYARTPGDTVEGSPYTISVSAVLCAPLGAPCPAAVLSNYSITYNTAPFTIVSAALIPLTVTANNATKLQGQPNPTFTVTYTGFVDQDSPSNLGGTLTFITNATTNSPVGAYAVTPGGLTSSKYSITFVSGTLSVVNAYATDQNIYTPPDYLTFQPPAVGAAYTDTPGFYTPIKRLSDSMHTTDAGTGNPSVVMISTEYSTMSPFNQDNTKLLLVHLSYFALYDGDGTYVRDLPLQINASSEPRWSRSDPNVLYYLQGNQLKQYNVGTQTTSVVHAFTEYSRISGKFKSDISFDGNHFVFVGDNRYVFVYEINTDSKGAVFDTGGVSFNNVGITPNGNVTIAWIAVGSNRYQGIELFDSNMNFLRQIARSDGHSDFTRDNGDEVLVWTNSNDPSPIPNCNNGVVKIRLADANQTCLAKFDWSLAVHISGTDNSGWVFVETYAPGDPIPPTGWLKYTDELMQVKLDGSQVVRRFAHHRSRPLNSYSYQPKLSISRDGRKLAYASNFGLQQMLGYPTEYSDAYSIDLSVISPDSVGSAYTGP